jgi:hypothetical protein
MLLRRSVTSAALDSKKAVASCGATPRIPRMTSPSPEARTKAVTL